MHRRSRPGPAPPSPPLPPPFPARAPLQQGPGVRCHLGHLPQRRERRPHRARRPQRGRGQRDQQAQRRGALEDQPKQLVLLGAKRLGGGGRRGGGVARACQGPLQLARPASHPAAARLRPLGAVACCPALARPLPTPSWPPSHIPINIPPLVSTPPSPAPKDSPHCPPPPTWPQHVSIAAAMPQMMEYPKLSWVWVGVCVCVCVCGCGGTMWWGGLDGGECLAPEEERMASALGPRCLCLRTAPPLPHPIIHSLLPQTPKPHRPRSPGPHLRQHQR
jgi:hypothetical protein